MRPTTPSPSFLRSALLLAPLAFAACQSAPRDELRMRDGRVAAALVHRDYDPQAARATMKVYHHLTAPDGRLLTKGEGGKFEHHRGLFVGWNHVKWNGGDYDFWHMRAGETQRFAGYLAPDALGMDEGAQVCEVRWQTKDAEVVVRERRGLQMVAEGDEHYTLLLRVELTAPNGPVELTGDPQHAGQQLRALDAFAADGTAPVRYLRPTFAKDQGNDVWTECAWTAAVLPMPQQPVTVLRIEGKDNPGDATWSTRPYGRFGATRTLRLQPGEPVVLDQYYTVIDGEQTAEWCRKQAQFWRR